MLRIIISIYNYPLIALDVKCKNRNAAWPTYMSLDPILQYICADVKSMINDEKFITKQEFADGKY